MPLIIITGLPSSGKSRRSQELAEFFRKREKTVHVVSENSAIPKAGFAKNEYFADSQKEKVVRADLKSEAIRLLTKDNVVILDGGNYIKGKSRIFYRNWLFLCHSLSCVSTGYRYELFCASKAARSTQCTVFCAIPPAIAWNFNQQRTAEDVVESSECDNSAVPYTREIFDALQLRYEEPIANNRWDAPLFTLLPERQLPTDEIFSALYEKKPPPPNLATQNVSFSLYRTYSLFISISLSLSLFNPSSNDRISSKETCTKEHELKPLFSLLNDGITSMFSIPNKNRFVRQT